MERLGIEVLDLRKIRMIIRTGSVHVDINQRPTVIVKKIFEAVRIDFIIEGIVIVDFFVLESP